jgi:hypothetical protein
VYWSGVDPGGVTGAMFDVQCLGVHYSLLPSGLKGWWPYATLFYIYFAFYDYSYHSLRPIHMQGFVGGTSMRCRADIRTRVCLTASQRITYLLNYAAPYLSHAAPLLSYAAPSLSYAAPLLSYAAPSS